MLIEVSRPIAAFFNIKTFIDYPPLFTFFSSCSTELTLPMSTECATQIIQQAAEPAARLLSRQGAALQLPFVQRAVCVAHCGAWGALAVSIIDFVEINRIISTFFKTKITSVVILALARNGWLRQEAAPAYQGGRGRRSITVSKWWCDYDSIGKRNFPVVAAGHSANALALEREAVHTFLRDVSLDGAVASDPGECIGPERAADVGAAVR